jgi:GNAT superfamily N-acetyltransferase
MDSKFKFIEIKNLSNELIDKYSNTIFNQFHHLINFPELNHSVENIIKLFKEPSFYGLFIIYENKKIGYIIGSDKILDDNRNIYYVDYIYISKEHRHKHLGSYLINIIEDRVKKLKMDGIMLICDTENLFVNDFYLRKGYYPDNHLRRFARNDVMYKSFTGNNFISLS